MKNPAACGNARGSVPNLLWRFEKWQRIKLAKSFECLLEKKKQDMRGIDGLRFFDVNVG